MRLSLSGGAPVALFLVALFGLAGCPQEGASAKVPPKEAPKQAPSQPTDEQALYALGAMLGRNIDDLHLTAAEVEAVKSGLGDQALGMPLKVDLAVVGPRAEQLRQGKRNAVIRASALAQKAKDQGFMKAAAAEPGARMLEGGAILRTLSDGSGASPTADDRVKVSYQGKLADGTVFDTSDKRGGEVILSLNEAVACWRQGLLAMKLHETAQLVCPSELAYGDTGQPPRIPGGATVVFKISLLELNPPEQPPPPPRAGQPHSEPAHP